MKSVKNIVVAILIITVIIVVFQNTEVVETKVLFATFSMPRAMLLFVCLLVGVVVGLFMGTKFSNMFKGGK